MNRLPHQLLFDCQVLLQEINKKYPKALKETVEQLQKIKKKYELKEIVANEYVVEEK